MTTGAVAVIGGGIGGMQASLDLAESGLKVYLIDSAPAIGGTMARLDKTFPTNDCAMCVMSPKLVECGRHLNIDIVTNAEIAGLQGEPGNFRLKVKKKPRFVALDKCTACGECANACPVELPSLFEEGSSTRKAVYRLYPQAVPSAFIIDKEEGKSPCRVACPAGVNAHGYVSLIGQGKYEEALDLIRERDPFPSICGRVCYHPCEAACLRKEVDEPVAIRELKRFLADYEMKKGGQRSTEKPEPPTGPEVAIIGAGPAGLTCASDLVRLGYQPVVYEKLPKAGGMLLAGIPAYRLPRDILEIEIKRLADLGIRIKTNTSIGKDITLSQLREKHRAVFIAVGAHLTKGIGVPGEDMAGVVPGVAFLREFNLEGKAPAAKKVVVVGGGNVAIDSARTALRLGVDEVTIVYRRSRAEMPASPWEIEEAELEGVKFHFLATPIKVLGEDGRATGMECIRMELGEPDESGRRRPIPIKGSEFNMEADLIIPAIGQSSDLSFLENELSLTDWGTIKTDSVTLATSVPGVFAGGDVVLGPAAVVDAIAAGHEAAISIDRHIKGEDIGKDREAELDKVRQVRLGAEQAKRAAMPVLPVADRTKDFSEVELGFTEDMALAEAGRCLNCAGCAECMECVKACEAGAIEHLMQPETVELEVGAVVVMPGFERFDATLKGEYGYGRYPNVVTSPQFERLLSPSGPTGGRIVRPSDEKAPKKIAFIQCVGSRDVACGREYCSSVCCMYSTKEAVIAKEHDKNIQSTVFFIDIRAMGKDFDRYYETAKSQYGVRYVRSQVSKIYQLQQSKNLVVRYVSEEGAVEEEEFDLVVLAVGIGPAKNRESLAEQLGIELDQYGFAKCEGFFLTQSTAPGVFVGGAFTEPKDIPETVVEGSSAASSAAGLLCESRWTLTREKTYPEERDVSEEDPRIGVVVCRCGKNIGSVVDVPAVVAFANDLPDVVHATEYVYSCSQDSLSSLQETIDDHNLNRVVVASCTPRTHDPLFRDTIQEAGLNRCLFEMANIREHCSWVHPEQPEEATEKAKTLVAMAVSKARLLYPLQRTYSDVTKKSLVIGGGISGMTAALSLADQGFEAHLVEKEKELGGNLQEIYSTLHGDDPQKLLADTIQAVQNNPLIRVYKEACVKELSGYVGNFQSTISTEGDERKIQHGIVILASGAQEHKPEEYLYGESDKVLTQRELEAKLHNGQINARDLKSVTMIQCVGSREEPRPYCSRICCSEAVKNALALKEQNPELHISVLYRDIRTYGCKERYYKEAREKGVVFTRYEVDGKPRVTQEDGKLKITLVDPVLKREVDSSPDLLILSAGLAPGENEQLAQILKVPLNADGFFMEAHAKIRPLDFSTDGIFLCGTAHSPRSIQESIAQARGAAMRAAASLAKDQLTGKMEVVRVNERLCRGCGICVSVCPYEAREIDAETGAAKVLEAICQGCGACAAACPSGATNHLGFEKLQVLSMLEEAIAE